ncbi:MAG: competence protein ComK [Sporolactobacillus sp.]
MIADEVDNYIIRQETIAILPTDSCDGSLESIVLEENRQFRCRQKPLRIIEESCVYYGSTYMGRKKSARSMGFKSMPPVCICSELSIFFIPLMAEAHRGCAWIAHAHVLNWQDVDKRSAKIEFSNRQTLAVKGNAASFGRKVMRAAQYRLTLHKRIANSPKSLYSIAVPEAVEAIPIKINEHGTYIVGA